jgi:FkbM family methyltransferase
MITTLLDIGCNVLGGYEHLKQYESIDGGNIRKIFIEPNPECWDSVEQKLLHIPNSTLIKKAISKHGGCVELITRGDVTADIAATIIGKDYLEASLSKCNMSVDHFNSYTIPSATITDILNEFNIIPENTILKLDVEGVEYDVLAEIITNNLYFQKIYCEFHIHNNLDSDRKASLIEKLTVKNINIIDWQ